MKYFLNEIFHFVNTACFLFSFKKDSFAIRFFHFDFIVHMITYNASIINLAIFIILLVFFLHYITTFLIYQYL
jgi:hypothetical protein